MLKFLMRRQSPWWSAGHAATRALWMLDKVPSTSLSSEQIGVCNWRLIRQASSSIIWVAWSIIEFIKASLSCLRFKENLVKSKHEPKKERAQVSPLDSKKKAIKHIKTAAENFVTKELKLQHAFTQLVVLLLETVPFLHKTLLNVASLNPPDLSATVTMKALLPQPHAVSINHIDAAIHIDLEVIRPIVTNPTLDPPIFQCVTHCLAHGLPILFLLIIARGHPITLELPSMLIYVLGPCDAQTEVDMPCNGILPSRCRHSKILWIEIEGVVGVQVFLTTALAWRSLK